MEKSPMNRSVKSNEGGSLEKLSEASLVNELLDKYDYGTYLFGGKGDTESVEGIEKYIKLSPEDEKKMFDQVQKYNQEHPELEIMETSFVMDKDMARNYFEKLSHEEKLILNNLLGEDFIESNQIGLTGDFDHRDISSIHVILKNPIPIQELGIKRVDEFHLLRNGEEI